MKSKLYLNNFKNNDMSFHIFILLVILSTPITFAQQSTMEDRGMLEGLRRMNVTTNLNPSEHSFEAIGDFYTSVSSYDPSKDVVPWSTGVALYSFRNSSFASAIEKAERSGVSYVEGFSFHNLGKGFDGNNIGDTSKEDRRKINQIMDENDVKMTSMYVSGAKNVTEWKSYFEIAKEFGMRYLVAEPEWDQLDMVDSLASFYKIKVAIHQHSKESGSIYWHPDIVLDALQGRPSLGVCADLGHWAKSGLDPVECLKTLEGHLLGIHLKDIDGYSESANLVAVGKGVIDFFEVVKELNKQKFGGLVVVECEHEMEKSLPHVVRALEYFHELEGKLQK